MMREAQSSILAFAIHGARSAVRCAAQQRWLKDRTTAQTKLLHSQHQLQLIRQCPTKTSSRAA